jgi:hypothetical protein
MKSRLSKGNPCYHTIQDVLFSRLLSENIKTKTHKTQIFPVVVYGCETWPSALWEQHRLRVFENKVLRKIFGPKRDEIIGGWRSCVMRNFNICTLQILTKWPCERGWDAQGV